MEKSEQPLIAPVHTKVVDPVPTGRKPIGLKAGLRTGRQLTEEFRTPSTEHFAVTQLVLGVDQIKPPQQRVGGQFRCPDQVAPAIGFSLAEAQQLIRAAFGVAPNPAM